MRNLIEMAYDAGKKSFPKYKNAPYLNPEFMSLIPNCVFGDDRGCKLRSKMYKEYIKGWTHSHIKSMEV